MLPVLRVLSEHYERACEARDDLTARLEAVNRRSRSVKATTEGSLAVGTPPEEAADIEGARAVLYRSTRMWMERTMAMEAILSSLASQIHEESRFRWPSVYETQPLPVKPQIQESAAERTVREAPPEPMRGGWSAPTVA